MQNQTVHRKLISAGSGSCYDDIAAGTLLTGIIEEILYKPLDWPLLVTNLVTELSCYSVNIISVATTNCASYLIKELGLNGIKAVSAPKFNFVSKFANNEPNSGDIAIVGMAGRFPGSDNLESFWKVLADGMDLHRQVSVQIRSHCQMLMYFRFQKTDLMLRPTVIPPGHFKIVSIYPLNIPDTLF
jgi:Beta-ketoacyl synthase, N-terminal domain